MTELSGNLFQGQLVRLTAPRPDDDEFFARWSEDADYLRALDTDIARPTSPDVFAERERYRVGPNQVSFRIRTLSDDTLIGFGALHSIEWNNQAAMLGIGIGDPAYRGKGYGSDALRLLLRYAFCELNLFRVGVDVIAYNAPAIRAYERVGFRHEGALRGAVLRDGRRWDRLQMGLLRDEWSGEGGTG